MPLDNQLIMLEACRAAAMAAAAWWLVGLVLWIAARRHPGRPVGVWARRVALPGARTAAELLLSIGLIGSGCSTTSNPAGPPDEAPRLIWVGPAPSPPSTSTSSVTTATTPADGSTPATGSTRTPTTEPSVPSTDTQPSAPVLPSSDSPPPEPATAARLEHEVIMGDNLWDIAREELEQRRGRPPTTAETAEFWRAVVEINRGRLRSSDPDLIRPGEIVALPAP